MLLDHLSELCPPPSFLFSDTHNFTICCEIRDNKEAYIPRVTIGENGLSYNGGSGGRKHQHLGFNKRRIKLSKYSSGTIIEE